MYSITQSLPPSSHGLPLCVSNLLFFSLMIPSIGFRTHPSSTMDLIPRALTYICKVLNFKLPGSSTLDCLSLAPEPWPKYISSLLLSFLLHRLEMMLVPSMWGAVRINELIHAHLLEHCLARSKHSINVYYELLLWARFLL